MHIKKVILVCALMMVTLGGCAASRSIGGNFENYKETFLGTIHLEAGRGSGKVSGVISPGGTQCTGTMSRDRSNNFVDSKCDQDAGTVSLSCQDGRRLLATWAADDCYSGYGRGADQNGNKLEIWYDQSVGLVQGQVATMDARKAGFPSLPPLAKSGSTLPPKGGGSGTGSGFFITDDGHFVTNHHVVKDAVRISVRTPDGKWRPARLLREDPSNDLAIGTIDSPSYSLPLGVARDIRRGDDLVVLGYPQPQSQGQEQKAVFGRINSVNGLGDDVRYFQMDAPIQSGNSGGPVINLFGEVIGVATLSLVRGVGGRERITDVHYAAKPAYLMPLVRAEGIQSDVRLSGRGRKMSMADIAERLKDGVVLIFVEK